MREPFVKAWNAKFTSDPHWTIYEQKDGSLEFGEELKTPFEQPQCDEEGVWDLGDGHSTVWEEQESKLGPPCKFCGKSLATPQAKQDGKRVG